MESVAGAVYIREKPSYPFGEVNSHRQAAVFLPISSVGLNRIVPLPNPW